MNKALDEQGFIHLWHELGIMKMPVHIPVQSF
jgi:hypothetical protein